MTMGITFARKRTVVALSSCTHKCALVEFGGTDVCTSPRTYSYILVVRALRQVLIAIVGQSIGIPVAYSSYLRSRIGNSSSSTSNVFAVMWYLVHSKYMFMTPAVVSLVPGSRNILLSWRWLLLVV